jgi:hypothetical protein
VKLFRRLVFSRKNKKKKKILNNLRNLTILKYYFNIKTLCQVPATTTSTTASAVKTTSAILSEFTTESSQNFPPNYVPSSTKKPLTSENANLTNSTASNKCVKLSFIAVFSSPFVVVLVAHVAAGKLAWYDQG